MMRKCRDIASPNFCTWRTAKRNKTPPNNMTQTAKPWQGISKWRLRLKDRAINFPVLELHAFARPIDMRIANRVEILRG
jgi:hypothetical protein